jgi:hypothetical protein
MKYGVFAWTQGQHSGSLDGLTTYNFTLFYVDRLKDDKSNQIEVQSVGCDTINNILQLLYSTYGIEAGNYTLQTFNQRFTDECAGVFCNVSFVVPMSHICEETYEAYSTDFSKDFVLY